MMSSELVLSGLTECNEQNLTIEEKAEAAENLIDELLSTTEGKELLIKKPAISRMIQNFINSVFAQYVPMVVGRDRQRVYQAVLTIMEDRRVRQQIGQETVNMLAYQAVLEDLKVVLEQVPVMALPINVTTEVARPGEAQSAQITSLQPVREIEQPKSRLILP